MRRTACVILAGGSARRMAPQNKLLLPGPDGRAMVAHVAVACLASGADEVVVTTGHGAEAVARALEGLAVRLVHAAGHAAGMAASLNAGLGALGPDMAAAAICLGDMPLVRGALIGRLLAEQEKGAGIVVPLCRGVRGNPVVWDRRYFAEMMALTGDAGARGLLLAHAADVLAVEVGDEAVLTDFDTPESLAGWV